MSNSAEHMVERFCDERRWADVLSDGYVLTDPLSEPPAHHPRDADHPCPWIAGDEYLGSGLAYLQRYTHNVHVNVTYTYDRTWEDGGDPEQFEKRIEEADCFGYAEIGCTQDSVDARNMMAQMISENVKRQEGAELADYQAEAVHLFGPQKDGAHITRGMFALREIAAAALGPTVSFSPDIARDGTEIERALLTAYEYFVIREPSGMTEEWALALTGLEDVREWCMVANLGRYLQKEHDDALREGRLVDVALSLRYLNCGVSSKMSSLGALPATEIVPKETLSMQALLAQERTIPAHHISGVVTSWKLAVPDLVAKLGIRHE